MIVGGGAHHLKQLEHDLSPSSCMVSSGVMDGQAMAVINPKVILTLSASCSGPGRLLYVTSSCMPVTAPSFIGSMALGAPRRAVEPSLHYMCGF